MLFDIFCYKKGELYGSGLPQSQEDLEQIKKIGIKVIISLTPEIKFLKKQIQLEESLEHYEILIPDGEVPTKQQAVKFLKILEKAKNARKPVLIHCLAGCGRAGVMLALAERFIYGTLDGKRAILNVREVRRCAIENRGQEEFILDFSDF